MASVVGISTPVVVQGVPEPGYSALDLRRLISAGMPQEGVLGPSSFRVEQTPATAGQLDISGGEAIVQGDSVSGQGMYYVRGDEEVEGFPIEALGSANPRIDQVVLEIKDDQHDGSGVNEARVRVVEGTPTSGATLDNRSGAAALPASCIRLADVLVPAGAPVIFIEGTHIRDRRPWARGAQYRSIRSANAGGTNDYTFGGAFALIDSVNLNPRIECSGYPIEVSVVARMVTAAGVYGTRLAPFVDGAAPDGMGTADSVWFYANETAAIREVSIAYRYTFAPAPGSHRIGLAGMTEWGTNTLKARATIPLLWTVRELSGPQVDNS